jgi:hypothetical protein
MPTKWWKHGVKTAAMCGKNLCGGFNRSYGFFFITTQPKKYM